MAIPKAIDTQIEKLIGRLAAADSKESARIRTRIQELKDLKAEHTTT